METKAVTNQIAEINQKLDVITAYIQEQQRRQREKEELKHDLIHIGKDVFQAAVTELEEVAPYFDTQDLLHLLKTLLRNVRNLNRLLDQMESVADFVEDAKPLSKEAFAELLHKLDKLDRKGYFDFMKETAKIIDTIVTSFSVEDVRLLRENITSILLTIKSMTQPEMLSTMDNALGFYRNMDIVVESDVSFRQILRELRKPEVKRGIVFLLEFIKSMANPNGSTTKLKAKDEESAQETEGKG